MITFLGDVALIEKNLKSDYKPSNPYVFNFEYVLKCENSKWLPSLNKINLSSENCEFEKIFGTLPIAVNVVNNHIYDFGEEGFQHTLSKIKDMGIINIMDEPVFIGDKICIFSYMLFEDNELFQFNKDKAKSNILKIRSEYPDIRIIVQMHWGIENCSTETQEQQKIGRWLIDNGVDLVIGHHPHCLQPVEEYNGKLIFYSLGNTLFGNINTPSHFDENFVPQRVYRVKWQSWNRRAVAVNYDEEKNEVKSIDFLYQKKNTLICDKQNISIKKLMKKGSRLSKFQFMFRKYYLFFVSNFFVDGKLFDMTAIKHELRGKDE